jgi:hypothetical protein
MEVNVISLPERAKLEAKSYLEELLSAGARKLLQAAIENEVAEYLQSQSGRRTESGQRNVVRNGHLPERDLVTGVGPVKIRQPRVRHRDGGSYAGHPTHIFLRLSSPTLVASAHHQSHWIDFCDGPAAHPTNQRLRLTPCNPDHGLQARHPPQDSGELPV